MTTTIIKVSMPTPPQRLFASDNASGIHPAYLEAIALANDSHELAYGDDRFTPLAVNAFGELADCDVDVLFTFGGTGANILALAILLDRAESVLCTEWSHIAVDETGAPERILGVKLQTVVSPDGKMRPEQIVSAANALGSVHHAQPGVVSISQPTELGTLYTVAEIEALCQTAHQYGMRVHVDGARIANAVAALGATREVFRALTFAAGVDALSFGGTKNAMLNAEAVLVSPQFRGRRAQYLHKQVTQLPSKMRFTSAQYVRALSDDLWISTATAANTAAQALFEKSKSFVSLQVASPAVNSLFPIMLDPAKTKLQEWSFFWDWDIDRHQVRWMTSWDTSPADIDAFIAGVDQVLSG